MNPDDLNKFKPVFLESARGHVSTARAAITKISANPSDFASIKEIHIVLHSLKSEFLVMNYQQTAKLCLDLEEFYKRALDSNTPINDEILSLTTEQINNVDQSINLIERNDTEHDLSMEVKKVEDKLSQQ